MIPDYSQAALLRWRLSIIYITTGTRSTAVTELILTSVGAKIFLARQSHKSVITLPPIKDAGTSTLGSEVLKESLIRCGTAIPTKETGPAKATTQAASMLAVNMSITLSRVIFTPILAAYASPRR